MGKQGPCHHCGVTSTPLWRNGPPEKPVLCNACGSRWRTKGTLANYTPLHARAEPDDFEERRVAKAKSISINKNKEMKPLKRKQNPDSMVMVGGILTDYNQGFLKVTDEDASNRSSSGSAISNSESCAQLCSGDASDLTGPAQSVVWDTMVPSRKRTCVNRPKQSSVEKLTKDLYSILQEQQSSYSVSSEEDLLFESETPMVSVEIGHGSVLIRHPNAIHREEESEASSLSVDNKHSYGNEAYSRSATLYDSKGVAFIGSGSEKSNLSGQGMQQEQVKREKSQHEIFQILGSRNSPLRHIDLTDTMNFEEFMRYLTNGEQQQLLKYLPSVDVSKLPESLKSFFDSPQFRENLTSFQQLLREGVFDISFSGEGVKPEDCKTLKRLALSNLSKSKWVEHYHLLKNSKSSSRASVMSGPNVTTSSYFANGKRSLDNQNKKFPEVKIVMKSPKRVIMKSSYDKKEVIDNDGPCFSPRSLFALPPDGSSFLPDSINFVEESSDQDLLLDVPSNGSFAQAELLHPALSFGSQQASTSSSSIYPHLFHP